MHHFTYIFNIIINWLDMFESGSNLIRFHMEKVDFYIPLIIHF